MSFHVGQSDVIVTQLRRWKWWMWSLCTVLPGNDNISLTTDRSVLTVMDYWSLPSDCNLILITYWNEWKLAAVLHAGEMNWFTELSVLVLLVKRDVLIWNFSMSFFPPKLACILFFVLKHYLILIQDCFPLFSVSFQSIFVLSNSPLDIITLVH